LKQNKKKTVDRNVSFKLPDFSDYEKSEFRENDKKLKAEFEQSDEYAQYLLNNYALNIGQKHFIQKSIDKNIKDMDKIGIPVELIDKRLSGQHVRIIKKNGVWIDAKED